MAARARYALWVLIAPPTIWAAHFLFAYVTAAIHCAKWPETDLAATRLLILGLTVVALLGIAVIAIKALRAHLASEDGLPHDEDEPWARRSFLGFATLLLCGLSAVAVLYVALPIAFFEVCR